MRLCLRRQKSLPRSCLSSGLNKSLTKATGITADVVMEVGAYFSAKEMHNQRYREGQEDQLGALGLVVNIIVL